MQSRRATSKTTKGVPRVSRKRPSARARCFMTLWTQSASTKRRPNQALSTLNRDVRLLRCRSSLRRLWALRKWHQRCQQAHGALPAAEICGTYPCGGPRDQQAKCLLFAASAEETGPGEDPRREMDAAKGTLEARVHLAMQAMKFTAIL
jgi:hypothetical protein